MPRKPKEPKPQRPLTLRDFAGLPAEKSSKKIETQDLLCESFRRNNKLQRLYIEWLQRAIDNEKPENRDYELLLHKYLAMEKHIHRAESVDFVCDNDCKSVRLGHISYDVSDPTKATITVNLFSSREEVDIGLKYVAKRLLFERTMLQVKSKGEFPPEIRVRQGVDAEKIMKSLDDLLQWYDKYKDLPVTAIVADMSGEEATRDDREYNRRKQAVYEKQRLAETCMEAARRGIFPPRNLTRARSKRPKSKYTS